MLGVTFGSKHSYNDWGIWLEDTHINPPLPKRYIVDVPARNGLLDLTPELTPTIRFENRTLTFKFRVKAGDWSTLVSQIHGDIHGRTLDVVSDLDPQWHWHGCVTVDDFSSDERTGVLVITVDAYPFKLSNTENSYTVNGNGTITCVVDRMEISPAFELTAPTTVIYGDSSYVLESTATTEKTLSGDIVSFADGTANPAIDLTADIDAVQDLHGYSHPWAGGAGKNLWHIADTTYTHNGVTFTVSNNIVTVNGTATGGDAYISMSASGTLEANQSYTISGCPSGGTSTTYFLQQNYWGGSQQAGAQDFGNGRTFTPLNNTIYATYIFIKEGTTVNNMVFKPMLEKGSTKSAYEPYANICPINGFDEVVTYVRGKNLWTGENSITVQSASGGFYIGFSTLAGSYKVSIPKGKVYFKGHWGGSASAGQETRFYYADGTTVRASLNTLSPNSDFTLSATLEKDAVGMFMYINNGGTLSNIMLTYEENAEYEPYIGASYTIDLDGTRYGGTLDVTTGVLTLTHGYVDLGSLNWVANASYSNTFNGTTLNPHAKFVNNITTWKCSDYASYISTIVGTVDAGISIGAIKYIVYVRDIRFNDPATFKTAMSGVQLVYELDTPQVVQLTPTQVMILKNQNNIWADSSEVEVTYLAQDFAGKTFYIPDLELTEGSHELTIQGTGTTKVTYTNGRL